MQSGEQTALGRFFDRHPVLLRTLAVAALVWGVGYLIWRIGWSGQGANPVAFGMLLIRLAFKMKHGKDEFSSATPRTAYIHSCHE